MGNYEDEYNQAQEQTALDPSIPAKVYSGFNPNAAAEAASSNLPPGPESWQAGYDTLLKQMGAIQGTTDVYKRGSPLSADTHMQNIAKSLAKDYGITNIGDIGVRYETRPAYVSGSDESAVTIPEEQLPVYYNKNNPNILIPGYKFASENRGDGYSEYNLQPVPDGKGGTIALPVQQYSKSGWGAFAQDLGPIIPIINLALLASDIPPITVAAGNVAFQAGAGNINNIGDILKTAAPVLVGDPGILGGAAKLYTAYQAFDKGQVLSGLASLANAAGMNGLANDLRFANAIKTGNVSGALLSLSNMKDLFDSPLKDDLGNILKNEDGVVQTIGNIKIGGEDGILLKEVAKGAAITANLLSDKPNYGLALQMAGDLAGSKDAITAGKALGLVQAIQSNNPSAIYNAALSLAGPFNNKAPGSVPIENRTANDAIAAAAPDISATANQTLANTDPVTNLTATDLVARNAGNQLTQEQIAELNVANANGLLASDLGTGAKLDTVNVAGSNPAVTSDLTDLSTSQIPASTSTITNLTAAQIAALTSSQIPARTLDTVTINTSQLPAVTSDLTDLSTSQIPASTSTVTNLTAAQIAALTSTQIPARTLDTVTIRTSQIPAVTSDLTDLSTSQIPASTSTITNLTAAQIAALTSSQIPARTLDTVTIRTSQLPAVTSDLTDLSTSQIPASTSTITNLTSAQIAALTSKKVSTIATLPLVTVKATSDIIGANDDTLTSQIAAITSGSTSLTSAQIAALTSTQVPAATSGSTTLTSTQIPAVTAAPPASTTSSTVLTSTQVAALTTTDPRGMMALPTSDARYWRQTGAQGTGGKGGVRFFDWYDTPENRTMAPPAMASTSIPAITSQQAGAIAPPTAKQYFNQATNRYYTDPTGTWQPPAGWTQTGLKGGGEVKTKHFDGGGMTEEEVNNYLMSLPSDNASYGNADLSGYLAGDVNLLGNDSSQSSYDGGGYGWGYDGGAMPESDVESYLRGLPSDNASYGGGKDLTEQYQKDIKDAAITGSPNKSLSNPLKSLADAAKANPDLTKALLAAGLGGLLGYIGRPKGFNPKGMQGNSLGLTQAQVHGALKGVPVKRAEGGGIDGYAGGGGLHYLKSAEDGMADKIPATIDNKQPAKLSGGEFVIPADVVSHLGNGNSEAGAKQLYDMMDRIRHARTGNKQQGKQINPAKFTPK